MKKIRRRIGDIVQISLDTKFHTYAHITTSPFIIFYDGKYETDLPIDKIPELPQLFVLSVYDYAIRDGIWPVIGYSKLSSDKLSTPYMFKQDIATGALSIYHADFSDTNYERSATFEECEGLERAAVWEPNHVVDRLIDHYAGRKNKWVESLRIQK